MRRFVFIGIAIMFLFCVKDVFAQEAFDVKYPKEIFDVLNNPGIGFTTFNRFNSNHTHDYPKSTIAYFRPYWSQMEPEEGKYNWQLIDKALQKSAEQGQTLMFRVMPYDGRNDVPAWYRKMVGEEKPERMPKWRVDPEDPRYVQHFGGMIAALGQRYDGHPDFESVDMSIVGFWGEGAGSGLLSDHTRIALINCYLDHFKKTPLHFLPITGGGISAEQMVKGTNIAASWHDGRNNGTGQQMRYVGYRVDCLGDFVPEGQEKSNWGYADKWSHMRDMYPRDIVRSGMADAWKNAPVTMEICWTFLKWLEDFKFDEEIVSYIFGEALKWHVSSFNAKSSPVPDVWSPLVDKWLNKMGYRFVLRKLEYPSFVCRQGQLSFFSLWENVGVAPIYKDYKLAIRLRNIEKNLILPLSANIREWLPGDILCEEKLYIPHDMPLGKYRLDIAIVSPVSYEPRVKLAIEGVIDDGWYTMGEIEIKTQ